MWYFWSDSLEKFGGWVPHEWYESPRIKQEWLKQRFGDDEHAGLYAPVPVTLKLYLYE